MIAAAVVGSAVVGGVVSNSAGKRQAQAANNASDNSLAASREASALYQENAREAFANQGTAGMFANDVLKRGTWDANAKLQPYSNMGLDASGRLQSGIQDGSLTRGFSAADLNSHLSPAYQFQLQQGQNQVANAMNMTGGLVSGNALQALNKYSQDYAQTAYQAAFNNYNTNQQNAFSRLSSVAGMGMGAASQMAGNDAALGSGLAGIATGTAQTQGNYLTQGAAGAANASMAGAQNAGNFATSGAAAQAAGQIGAANAMTSGVNSYMGWNYLNSQPGGVPSGQVKQNTFDTSTSSGAGDY